MYEFDIVIPIYNNIDRLQKCLESLEKTISNSKRLILVDDTSTSKDFILGYKSEKFKEKIIILNGNHQWFTRTVNRGFRLTKERFVFCINSDCEFENGWLEEIFEVLEMTNAGLVGVDYDSIVPSRFEILQGRNYVTGHCLLFDRSKTFDVIGYLNEENPFTVHYASDSDYCYRLIENNIVVVKSFKSKVKHINDEHPSANLIGKNDTEINRLSKQDFDMGVLD